MLNQAEVFLNNWASEYEQSEGEIDQPDFSGIEKNYTENKTIPHYLFSDSSVLIVFINIKTQTQYESYQSEEELEEERDLDCEQLGHEYAIVDIFNTYD